MKFSAILLMICLALIGLSAKVFANQPFKACGEIQQSVGTLTFVQWVNGERTVPSSVYGKTPDISKQLSLLVGFREVCVEAIPDEGDIVVIKVLSQIE